MALKCSPSWAKRQQSAEGEQVRNLLFSKRRIAVLGATVALALAGGGAALAYFTSTGTGTGAGTVGTATAYTVAVSAPSGGPLTPGGATESFTYTVKNNSSGSQAITSASISVAPDATAAGLGCSAAWYQVSGIDIATPANPATQTYTAAIPIAAGATSSDAQLTFTVTLINEPLNQDACEGDVPVVTVAVS
jgi:hypothetical protein